MKKAKSVALIGAGRLTDSPLSRFYWLSDRLGPVKSSSYRLASRIANQLRAGFAVKGLDEFRSADLILVCVPDQALPRVLQELASAAIDFRGKAVVLVSVTHDTSELAELSTLGAAVASVCPIPGFDDLRYLIEGDPLAVLLTRRLVEHRDRRAITIERSRKFFYLAALTCTGSLLFALLLAAAESLRQAGFTPVDSTSVMEKQLGRTLRSYVRGGRKGYPPPQDLARYVRALALADPELSQYLEQSARLAERLLSNRRASSASSRA